MVERGESSADRLPLSSLEQLLERVQKPSLLLHGLICRLANNAATKHVSRSGIARGVERAHDGLVTRDVDEPLDQHRGRGSAKLKK